MRSRHDGEWCNRLDDVASHVIEVKVYFRPTRESRDGAGAVSVPKTVIDSFHWLGYLAKIAPRHHVAPPGEVSTED
jgi:hypothetical protein